MKLCGKTINGSSKKTVIIKHKFLKDYDFRQVVLNHFRYNHLLFDKKIYDADEILRLAKNIT